MPSDANSGPPGDAANQMTDNQNPADASKTNNTLKNAYNTIKQRQCKVGSLRIHGLERTKPKLVERELEGVLAAQNLEEINYALMDAYSELMSMDVFEAVQVVIDQSDKGSDFCDVGVTVREKGPFSFRTGTYVQGGEGNIEMAANAINPFGNGERITLSADYGTRLKNDFAAAYTQPRIFGSRWLGIFKFHQLFQDFERWSSYTELLRGGEASVTSDDGRHSFTYELAWRRLADPSRLASHAVRSQLGDQLKSAIKHEYIDNTLDGPLFPTTGYGLKMFSEVSGLGPDSKLLRFIRHHLQGQVAFPIGDSSSLTICGEAGIMLPWGAGAFSRTTSISDRFFLGGVGSLRGFQHKGAGPVDAARRPKPTQGNADEDGPVETARYDAVGGDLLLGLTAAYNFQVPVESFKAAGIHGQVFCNGGSLAPLGGGSVRNNLREFQTSFRWTVGAGLVWINPMGRLELNYCRVLSRQPFDRTMRHGLQFGLTPHW